VDLDAEGFGRAALSFRNGRGFPNGNDQQKLAIILWWGMGTLGGHDDDQGAVAAAKSKKRRRSSLGSPVSANTLVGNIHPPKETTMRRFVFAAFALTVFAACQPATTELTEVQEAEIAAAVERRVAEYGEAVHSRDMDWFSNFWAAVDGFVFAGDGELSPGHDEYMNQLRESMEGMMTLIRFGFSNGHTYVLAPDAASHTAAFDWSIVNAAGDTVSSRGSWTYVFKRFDGEWKVVHSNGTHIYY
jgi:ketosteroid isomerase-like protein